MSIDPQIALLGLGASFLAALVTTTWKTASLTTKLILATERYDRDRKELLEKTEALALIPDHERRLLFVEKNLSLVPQISERLRVAEDRIQTSKEHRAQSAALRAARASRPDLKIDDE